jgi:electron transfer flavoprotein beta subunit
MVTKIIPATDGIGVWREVEGGHEIWRAVPPFVGLVHKSEKEPRYPSLPGIMKAKKKEIPEKTFESLGVTPTAQRVEVLSMEPPPQRGGGKIFKLDGDAKGVAEQVARALHEEAKVL